MSILSCRNKDRGGAALNKKVNAHPKIPEIDLDFSRLLLKLFKFGHKTVLRCISGKDMVTYGKFKTITLPSQTQKFSKKCMKFGSKKVNIALKFLKLT